jgi:hypothetical protein
MVIAVVAMGVVKVALYQIVDVIPMRHRFMAAVHSMSVTFFMAGAYVARCTFLWIR